MIVLSLDIALQLKSELKVNQFQFCFKAVLFVKNQPWYCKRWRKATKGIQVTWTLEFCCPKWKYWYSLINSFIWKQVISKFDNFQAFFQLANDLKEHESGLLNENVFFEHLIILKDKLFLLSLILNGKFFLLLNWT